MQVLFLGYGVGQFELEMLHGSPQLIKDKMGASINEEDDEIQMTFTTQASSRFDLSAHPNPSPPRTQSPSSSTTTSSLRSSWASSSESQERLTQRTMPDPTFSDSMQFGARQPPPSPSPSTNSSFSLPLDNFAGAAALTQSNTSRTLKKDQGEGERAPDSMPPNNRIIVSSSVVLYQDTMVNTSARHEKSTQPRYGTPLIG